MNCGCNITTKCEQHKKTLFKCNKCKAIFHDHEIKVKYKNGSNVCDRDKTTHCPKCDSEYFTMQ